MPPANLPARRPPAARPSAAAAQRANHTTRGVDAGDSVLPNRSAPADHRLSSIYCAVLCTHKLRVTLLCAGYNTAEHGTAFGLGLETPQVDPPAQTGARQPTPLAMRSARQCCKNPRRDRCSAGRCSCWPTRWRLARLGSGRRQQTRTCSGRVRNSLRFRMTQRGFVSFRRSFRSG